MPLFSVPPGSLPFFRPQSTSFKSLVEPKKLLGSHALRLLVLSPKVAGGGPCPSVGDSSPWKYSCVPEGLHLPLQRHLPNCIGVERYICPASVGGPRVRVNV